MTGPEPPPAAEHPQLRAAPGQPEPDRSAGPPTVPLALDAPAPEPPPPSRPASSQTDPTQAPRPQRAAGPGGTHVRLLLTLLVSLVSLFLFLRTFALEPFGVPTGSMAPALIGNHREADCPRCGCPVRVGAPGSGTSPAHQFERVGCPNCGKEFSLIHERDVNGDRLLVDKNVFNLRAPRRWEMAVFRCPDPDPKEFGKPYVKRVIGLPGESILVRDGDVYANGQLLRKDWAEVRETRMLVFSQGFVPETGWDCRWLVEPPEDDPRLPPATDRPLEVADARVVRDETLTLDAAAPDRPFAGLRYRNFNLDKKIEEPVRAWNSYDGGVHGSFGQFPVAHDFSLEFDIDVVAATAGAAFEVGLSDGSDTALVEISVGPRTQGLVTLTRHGQGGLGAVRGTSLEPGTSHHLEFAFVDRRVLFALDGRSVFQPVDLPPAGAPDFSRPEVSRPVLMRARSCFLEVHDLKLYRDVYYTQFGEHGTQKAALLGPRDYFMMGDNSGNSQDSRKWPTPGVPEADFIGKPFLIHQPLRPGRLGWGAQKREFQTIDWSRMRWLH